MELLLKAQMLYTRESTTKRDYIAHNVSAPTKPVSLHHKPSTLYTAVRHTPEPPTCRKPIVRQPLVTLPSFQRELVALNGGRYRIQAIPPSSAGGTSAQQWEVKHDEERRQEEQGEDIGREKRAAFNRPLLRSM